MQKVQEYFSCLNKVYISIILVSCLFIIFALVTTESDLFSEHDIPYVIADGVVVFIGIAFTYYYSKKEIKEAQKKRGLREKLYQYRKVLFYSWTILANVTAFSIVCYIFSGEHLFICPAIFILLLMLLRKPSAKKLIEQMDLAKDEQRIIENPKSAL